MFEGRYGLALLVVRCQQPADTGVGAELPHHAERLAEAKAMLDGRSRQVDIAGTQAQIGER
jgi:hypothetical protein